MYLLYVPLLLSAWSSFMLLWLNVAFSITCCIRFITMSNRVSIALATFCPVAALVSKYGNLLSRMPIRLFGVPDNMALHTRIFLLPSVPSPRRSPYAHRDPPYCHREQFLDSDNKCAFSIVPASCVCWEKTFRWWCRTQWWIPWRHGRKRWSKIEICIKFVQYNTFQYNIIFLFLIFRRHSLPFLTGGVPKLQMHSLTSANNSIDAWSIYLSFQKRKTFSSIFFIFPNAHTTFCTLDRPHYIFCKLNLAV